MTTDDKDCALPTWPTICDPCGDTQRYIDEDWLREHGFRVETGRNDERYPVRRLPIARHGIDGPQPFEAGDDLCIDVAPTPDSWSESNKTWLRWHVWIMQVEPWRHIHVRYMRQRWEIAKLYEGLTGRCWPGTL